MCYFVFPDSPTEWMPPPNNGPPPPEPVQSNPNWLQARSMHNVYLFLFFFSLSKDELMLIHDVFLRLMVFLLKYISTFNTAHRLVKFARNMLIEQKQICK